MTRTSSMLVMVAVIVAAVFPAIYTVASLA